MADEAPAPAAPAPAPSPLSIAATIADRLRTAPEPSAPSGGAQDPPAAAGGTAPAPDESATGADRGADNQPGGEADSPAPLDPPRSWSKDARERWSRLDRADQEYLLQRDSEDTAAVRRGQNEAADARKKAEADIAQIQAERQRTAAQLQFLSQHIQTFDPVLAEGNKTDWTKLAQENPADYVAKRAQYDHRLQVIQAIQGEQQRLHSEALGQAKGRMVEAVRRELNLHDDKAWNAFDQELTHYLLNLGYRPEVLQQVVDPVAVLTARKAMLYDKMQADRAALDAKKKAPPPTRTMRAGALQDGPGTDARFEAAKKAALKSGSARQVADVIAARLRTTPQP
jgi:hypothetical protein